MSAKDSNANSKKQNWPRQNGRWKFFLLLHNHCPKSTSGWDSCRQPFRSTWPQWGSDPLSFDILSLAHLETSTSPQHPDKDRKWHQREPRWDKRLLGNICLFWFPQKGPRPAGYAKLWTHKIKKMLIICT